MRRTWLLLTFAAMACKGSLDNSPAHRPSQPTDAPPGESPIPTCPYDPDCFAGGDCDVECPSYWVCETHPSGKGYRCTNPGPDYPDQSQAWRCEDVAGRTTCRGSRLPDDGGGSQWSCELQDEFAVCTKNTPEYPDRPGEGPWNCYFQGEFRVCDSSVPDAGGWTCIDAPTGRECRQQNPSFPDDREWTCFDAGGNTTCTGRGPLPDGGSGSPWDCAQGAEFVICRNDEPSFPDSGSGSPWACEYQNEFRICRQDSSSPGEPGSPGDDDDDEPGRPGRPVEVCVDGAQRWCDDATYCSWGKQTCLPDGHWGPCVEPEVTGRGRDVSLADRPNTPCACRSFYFDEECCEDQEDRNRDGHADCIIPADHTPPVCEGDGSLCSFCDSDSDCAAGARCLFGSDGHTFCSQACDDETACPGGFECTTIPTRGGSTRQCTPNESDGCN